MLEVIDKGASSSAHPTPVLFVHGGWHGAWCWDGNFLNFFADAGYRAVALSVRGHGGSPTTKPLSRCSVADYVEDVRTVADGLPKPPALIGHSMGGFLVQMYLADRRAPAGVLLASMPSHARRRVSVAMRTIRRHPLVALRANTGGSTADLVNTPAWRETTYSLRTRPNPLSSRVLHAWGRRAGTARDCPRGSSPHA